jgi:hypothetical protein
MQKYTVLGVSSANAIRVTEPRMGSTLTLASWIRDGTQRTTASCIQI